MTTRRYVLSLISRLLGSNRANAFQVGCPNILSSVFILKRLHDHHRFSADPFGALAEFKAILEKTKKQTIRELSRKTPDSIGAKFLIAFTVMETRRTSIRLTYRTESSSTTIGRRYATTESTICRTTSALERSCSENTAMSRDV